MLNGKAIVIEGSDLNQKRQKKFFLPPDDKEWINKTLLRMGYPDLNKANARVLDKVHESIDSVKQLYTPTFLFKTQAIKHSISNEIHTQSFRIKSPNWSHVASGLSGSKYVCCFATTLGIQCEEEIKKLGPNEILLSFIWDSLLSTIADHFADQAEKYISAQCQAQGLINTRRFSPGYCDLDLLQGQNAIFSFCQPEKIGIQINNGGLMIPRKSVTGFILLAEIAKYSYPCSFCRRDCSHRRTNLKGRGGVKRGGVKP